MTVTLDMNKQVVLDMSKTFSLNMEKKGVTTFPTLRTRAAIDCSGSMYDNFENGYVGKSVDRFIAAAMKFDDNGELEIGFFNTSFAETPVATIDDAGDYMTTKAKRIVATGGTKFAPVIAWTLEADAREGSEQARGFFGGIKKLFGAKSESSLPDCGQYTAIITDGANMDKAEFENLLKKTDSKNSFYQFIGIGPVVDVQYLTDISNKFQNVGFAYIENPLYLSNDGFFELLSNDKFVGWIASYNAARTGK